MKAPRILFVPLEHESWSTARSWSYGAHLGLEEGLRANGADVRTHNSIAARWVKDLEDHRTYDQVWVQVSAGRPDPSIGEWIRKAAPVRLGLLGESLTYPPDEETRDPWLARHRSGFGSWAPFLTHAACVDEIDVATVAETARLKTTWWPQAVPARILGMAHTEPTASAALFMGAAYRKRAPWLNAPELKGLLEFRTSPDAFGVHAWVFEALNRNVQRYLNRTWMPGKPIAARLYGSAMRALRRRSYRRWMESIGAGIAVVNLPSFVGAYPSRVVEAMARGRPVISSILPNRPRARSLFREGEEILLFSDGAFGELARQIRRLQAEPGWAASLARKAKARVADLHTCEYRVRQFLQWIETDVEPRFA